MDKLKSPFPAFPEIEAEIYLEKLDISTSDGKGIGKPVLNIKAKRSDPHPRFTPWYKAKVTSSRTNKLLFTITDLHIYTYPTTAGFNIKFLIELNENDRTYPDTAKFQNYYVIPYKPDSDELSYSGIFEFTHSADFNEGAVRKIVRTVLSIKFKYVVNFGSKLVKSILYSLRNSIKDAGAQKRYPDITPEMIAGILYDEIYFANFLDDWQNIGAELSLTNDSFKKTFGRFLVSFYAGLKSLDEVSIGIAQMQVRTLQRLVEQNYLDMPPNWSKDSTDTAIKFLLDPAKAPYAVAAELQRIVDLWRAGSVDISKNYPVLLYLYTVGGVTAKGVNPNPQSDPEGAGVRKASYLPLLNKFLR